MTDDFYMILPSNSCPLTQPNNKANEFIVDWQNPIELPGTWEAALTEFSYMNRKIDVGTKELLVDYGYSISNYKNSSYDILYSYDMNDPLKINVKMVRQRRGDITFKFELDYGSRLTITKFPSEPNDRIWISFNKNSGNYKKLGFRSSNYQFKNDVVIAENQVMPAKNLLITFLIVDSNNLVSYDDFSIYPKGSYEDEVSLIDDIVSSGEYIFKSFKINKKKFVEFETADNIVSIKFPLQIANMLNIPSTQISTLHKFVSKKKVPIRITKAAELVIISNLIDPINVGGQNLPVLRSIYLNKDIVNSNVYNEIIDYPMYIPVLSSSINNISIKIQDFNGNSIRFNEGSKTMLTIHFRKRINKF